jgi:hypothetical protein
MIAVLACNYLADPRSTGVQTLMIVEENLWDPGHGCHTGLLLEFSFLFVLALPFSSIWDTCWYLPTVT